MDNRFIVDKYYCFLFFRLLASFIHDLFQLYTDLYFTYLEINPLGKNGNSPFLKISLLFYLISLSVLHVDQGKKKILKSSCPVGQYISVFSYPH